MDIPLKEKYRTTVRGRQKSKHNDSAKKVKKTSGGRTTIVYNPNQHVLLVQGNGKRKFLHGADAEELLKAR